MDMLVFATFEPEFSDFFEALCLAYLTVKKEVKSHLVQDL